MPGVEARDDGGAERIDPTRDELIARTPAPRRGQQVEHDPCGQSIWRGIWYRPDAVRVAPIFQSHGRKSSATKPVDPTHVLCVRSSR